ncbi:hypothetical protein OXW40_01940 [Campylobacter hepaticus]|uniref:hypothetical protein n=1 Tax=Campylobacter hepaticus TaxID=1813019 RepID=UPI0029B6CA34|nr:hypothetical protein [Campylobacter hepaticus]MDX2323005.1 hypothetical protein [Campylobacter hepaticus]MDX2332341.1 hypothetical protein [Campylobacter hepaticus]MDX2409328.1 hypothetical protein [Campylobacter hepaticus]
MLEDDFLKERQNIRQKMLKFSRAMNQGKPLDDDLKEELSSDNILRRRFNKKSNNNFLEELDQEYNTQHNKKSNIYLKKDLINVKLEEKQSFAKIFFSKIKARKNKKNKKNLAPKEKKINNTHNIQIKSQKQTLNNNNLIITSNKQETIKSFNKTQQINPKTKQSQALYKKSIKENQINIKQSLENLQKKIQDNIQKISTPPIQIPVKQNNEDSQKIKNVLLEGFSKATKEDKNLNFNHLLFAILFVICALFLFTPQIYIRNQIYYLSREIAILKTEESVLNEENKDLKRRLENMRFQNQILDYLE